jgi:transposase
MTIAPDLVAQILRLHTVEKWRVGTIARQLHVHRDAVRRVLAGNRAPVHTSPLRPSRIDPYRPFILATLEKFPTLTAARLHAMVAERGYVGGPSHFRLLVAQMRPRPPAQAFLRLRTLPGEQAQVDWGHFGHLQIGRARRALMAFVMVLSHSRMVFLRFFLDARMDSFLRGHALAFVAFGGVPRKRSANPSFLSILKLRTLCPQQRRRRRGRHGSTADAGQPGARGGVSGLGPEGFAVGR